VSRRRTAAIIGPVVLLLAACGSGRTEVTDPPPDPLSHPVVAVGQARNVLDAVQSALVRRIDPTAVDARLLGPFREIAVADARAAAERKTQVTEPARVQELRLIVPATKSWPRFFVAVGNTRES